MNQERGASTEVRPEFLQSLRSLAMPVVVVGAAFASEKSCVTATLSYVSVRPAMVSTSLSRSSKTYELAHQSKAFSISLLRSDQAEIAAVAGRHGVTSDKFAELDIAVKTWSDVPALADSAVLWCSIEEECPAGDYVVCVGRIQEVSAGSREGRPLLRYDSQYHAMGDPLEVAEESTYPL